MTAAEPIHLYCCDPDGTALCGARLAGLEDVGYDEKRLCPTCYLIDTWGDPCPLCADPKAPAA